ncbi:MAG: ligase-associated DNA damage response endonuclease PdeM [Lewinellaceae bacterium]|nr:ligase-associated DNA damage response endonuclease PdeM [Lewinellaceae bacterium]
MATFTSASLTIAGEDLLLHPLRALYWPREQTLMLADLHLGKVAHFRQRGMPVPSDAGESNWEKLIFLLLEMQPRRVILLGDLFHSVYNDEWESFAALRQQFADREFMLVPGNHDILHENYYHAAKLTLVPEGWQEGPFLLSHHPWEVIPEGAYNLAGHLHPGVRLRGGGRQSLRLPCFWFGRQQGILPAFGAFTGYSQVQPSEEDQVFVIANDQVIAVS